MRHLAARVEAYKEFVRCKWPDPLRTKHIDAAGMQANVKRVVLLLCTQHPAPAVLMSPDKAVLWHDIIDPSSAHVSAFEVCTSWAVSLNILVEPVLIGPVTLSSIDAAVLVFAVPIPSSMEALPVLLNTDIAEWLLVPRLSGMLRAVTDIAFAKLASFMGPSPNMSTLFDPQVKVGAVSAVSVAVSSSAPQGTLVPFEYSVIKAVKATKHLRHAMLSSAAAKAIQTQVKDMLVVCPASVDVKAVLSSFADRIIDPPLQDIPLSVQASGCQELLDQYYATLPFDESCLPPETSWYPLLPEQQLPKGFSPTCESDLYFNLPLIRHANDEWFGKELQIWITWSSILKP